MIKMIFAMTNQGVIGKNNKLPWSIPSELKHFKETTDSHDMLMGRKTFESLPKKLPGRKHIVFTNQKTIEGADMIVNSKEQIFNLFDKYKEKQHLFVIGGKSLIENFYNEVDEIILTIIKKDYEGNIKINIDLKKWKRTELEDNKEFKIYSYIKEKQ